MARALRAARRDPDRARQLARDALARLRAIPGVEAQARAAEEWLAVVEGR